MSTKQQKEITIEEIIERYLIQWKEQDKEKFKDACIKKIEEDVKIEKPMGGNDHPKNWAADRCIKIIEQTFKEQS